MRKIVANFIEDSRSHHDKLEIFCPDCTKEELQYLVDFLYDGEIRCENSEESVKIFKILTEIFGFPDYLLSRCQTSFGDRVTPEVQLNEPNLVILNNSDEVVENNDTSEAVTLEVTLDQNIVENLNFQNLEEIKSQSSNSRTQSFNEKEINLILDENVTKDDVNRKNPEGKDRLFYWKLWDCRKKYEKQNNKDSNQFSIHIFALRAITINMST